MFSFDYAANIFFKPIYDIETLSSALWLQDFLLSMTVQHRFELSPNNLVEEDQDSGARVIWVACESISTDEFSCAFMNPPPAPYLGEPLVPPPPSPPPPYPD